MNHAAIRYLESKRSVDERAHSERVFDEVRRRLPSDPRIVEAGCGTGTMVPRLYEGGVEAGSYRGVDRDEQVVRFASYARSRELEYLGFDVEDSEQGFAVGDLHVSYACDDAMTAFEEREADLFVAASFADLVPLDDLLERIETVLRPGGLAYIPFTFDGTTVFQPDHPADEVVERAYHDAIDEKPGRDSRAGRHLADRFRQRSGTLLAMAPSDWIVRPRLEGYPADEAYFLGRILDFVAEALDDSSASNPDFDEWIDTRRRQLEREELTYVAHQYDFLYRTAED